MIFLAAFGKTGNVLISLPPKNLLIQTKERRAPVMDKYLRLFLIVSKVALLVVRIVVFLISEFE